MTNTKGGGSIACGCEGERGAKEGRLGRGGPRVAARAYCSGGRGESGRSGGAAERKWKEDGEQRRLARKHARRRSVAYIYAQQNSRAAE